LLLAFASAVILGFEHVRTHDHTAVFSRTCAYVEMGLPVQQEKGFGISVTAD
jgi:hypothetical protein